MRGAVIIFCSAFKKDEGKIDKLMNKLPPLLSQNKLNLFLNSKKDIKSLQFAFHSALIEMYNNIGTINKPWLKTNDSAILIDLYNINKNHIDMIVENNKYFNNILTFKIKVGIKENDKEQQYFEKLRTMLPMDSKFRIDANGIWNMDTSLGWIDYLKDDPRLEWIEQPLNVDDLQGHVELNKLVPIALDESLIKYPKLIKKWSGWKIRRPSLEGNPKQILKEFSNNPSYQCISTSFETGIGLRWLHHLSNLQKNCDTPTSPGLAKSWLPESKIFSDNPEIVWDEL